MAAQLIAIGFVLNVVADIPQPYGCLIGGLVIIIYFTAGGLVSTAWVNLVQLIVLLVGILVALPLTLNMAGGWSNVVTTLQVSNKFWSFLGSADSGWPYLIMLGPAFIVSPGLLQKIYGARETHTDTTRCRCQRLRLATICCGASLTRHYCEGPVS